MGFTFATRGRATIVPATKSYSCRRRNQRSFQELRRYGGFICGRAVPPCAHERGSQCPHGLLWCALAPVVTGSLAFVMSTEPPRNTRKTGVLSTAPLTATAKDRHSRARDDAIVCVGQPSGWYWPSSTPVAPVAPVVFYLGPWDTNPNRQERKVLVQLVHLVLCKTLNNINEAMKAE